MIRHYSKPSDLIGWSLKNIQKAFEVKNVTVFESKDYGDFVSEAITFASLYDHKGFFTSVAIKNGCVANIH